MTYVKTTLQHSIDIDAIITLHYFEYMKISNSKASRIISGNFFMSTKEPLQSVPMIPGQLFIPVTLSFTSQMNSMPLSPSGKIHPIWSSCLSLPVRRPCLSS